MTEVRQQESLSTLPRLEKKSKTKKEGSISKKMINIIRTTQRNNIDLTAIADNKANVLLSLNALIVAAMVPIVIANVDIVFEKMLIVPLMVLAITNFVTMFMAAEVLKPSNFDKMRSSEENPNIKSSPFFFGNFYQMEAEEYYDYIKDSLTDNKDLKAHLAQDLYYIGKRLGQKMSIVRKAYNTFIIGIFFTLIATGAVLFIF